MDINKKLKDTELLVEDLNQGIDNLLGESIFTILKLLIKGKKYIPKAIAMATGTKVLKAIVSREEEVEELSQSDAVSAASDIMKLKDEIDKLLSSLKKLEEKKLADSQYKKIHIEFSKKVELDIESLNSPEFQRSLTDTMYFSVVGLDEVNRYMELKTNTFPDTHIIKLTYETLDTYQQQKGDASLIYSKYGNPDLKPKEGNLKDAFFKILKIE